MELVQDILELFFSWFGTLEAPLKVAVIAGLLMPLLALYSYMRPAPPPPLPPPDGTVVFPDGKRANIYIDGEPLIIKRPKR